MLFLGTHVAAGGASHEALTHPIFAPLPPASQLRPPVARQRNKTPDIIHPTFFLLSRRRALVPRADCRRARINAGDMNKQAAIYSTPLLPSKSQQYSVHTAYVQRCHGLSQAGILDDSNDKCLAQAAGDRRLRAQGATTATSHEASLASIVVARVPTDTVLCPPSTTKTTSGHRHLLLSSPAVRDHHRGSAWGT